MHYFIFGLLIIFLALFFKKNHQIYDITPTVSLVIAAYNEEKIIRQKILNTLNLDYPKDKIEIIIVCDGSTDNTPVIVSEFVDERIICLFQDKRLGKTAALNRAIRITKNEILIFS